MTKTTFAALGVGVIGLLVAAGCVARSNETDSAPAPAPMSDKAAAPVEDHSKMNHGSMTHTMGTSGLDALKSLSDKEFDIAFLSQMIPHHQGAVDMAQQALKTATKDETKAEAQKVVDSQTKEIAEMTGYLKTLYNATPDAGQQELMRADMKDMMAMPVSSDKMFFEMMIPHHEGAVTMSELALKQGASGEVKALAQRIITGQKAEIALYRRLLEQM